MSFLADLRNALGRENVLSSPSELAVYDCDAFTVERRTPGAVVFPRSTQDVVEVVKLCRRHHVAVVARGAGTSRAGGCLPISSPLLPFKECATAGLPSSAWEHARENTVGQASSDTLVLMLTRMNKILKIDLRNRMAVVEPGVVNSQLALSLLGTGYHFAPDPASQTVSTLGGNAATNAGGPHTLKYGVTVNHILGLEAVLADGGVLQVGPSASARPLDLVGILIGSEGTLAIITKLWVRLTPTPQDNRVIRAVFKSPDDACNATGQIIAAGVIPAAMELMDRGILAAVEEAFHFGFPADAGAVLIIEVDGLTVGLDRQQERVTELCRRFGASDVAQATSAEEKAMLWKCRRSTGGTIGRLSPSSITLDGVVPRTKLPHLIRRAVEIGRKYNLRVVNVAHAGDGNLHPLVLFDERDREQVGRATAAGREILEECIAAGGSISAEHGIGVEKLALMSRQFAPSDLEAMRRMRYAFDPVGIFNPGKAIPT
jgi:glycolate oxidase